MGSERQREANDTAKSQLAEQSLESTLCRSPYKARHPLTHPWPIAEVSLVSILLRI